MIVVRINVVDVVVLVLVLDDGRDVMVNPRDAQHHQTDRHTPTTHAEQQRGGSAVYQSGAGSQTHGGAAGGVVLAGRGRKRGRLQGFRASAAWVGGAARRCSRWRRVGSVFGRASGRTEEWHSLQDGDAGPAGGEWWAEGWVASGRVSK